MMGTWKSRLEACAGARVAEWLRAHERREFRRHVDSGHVIVGAHSYGCPAIAWDKHSASRVIIGRYCSIASQVTIHTGGNHNVRWISTYPHRAMFDMPGRNRDGHPSSKGDVRIGNDVWIAHGASILSGVAIGDGAVVAAGALVCGDVAPYTIVGGVPARLIRKRFAEPEIAALLALAWWDWPDNQVKEAVPLLCSEDLTAFLQRYGRGNEASLGSGQS